MLSQQNLNNYLNLGTRLKTLVSCERRLEKYVELDENKSNFLKLSHSDNKTYNHIYISSEGSLWCAQPKQYNEGIFGTSSRLPLLKTLRLVAVHKNHYVQDMSNEDSTLPGSWDILNL